MNKEELTEYRNYVLSRYDEWLYATEKRGASYGECAYFESLTEDELDEMCAELDAEFEKLDKSFIETGACGTYYDWGLNE